MYPTHQRYYNHKLRGAHNRIWRWTKVSIAVTILLFSADGLCDAFHLRSRTVFVFLGSIGLLATLALGILLSLVDAVAITIYPKRGRSLEIVLAWLYYGFFIALLGLFGLSIFAGLFLRT